MATQSFYEDLIIDTPEKARRLIEALKETNKRTSEENPVDYYGMVEKSDRILLGKQRPLQSLEHNPE